MADPHVNITFNSKVLLEAVKEAQQASNFLLQALENKRLSMWERTMKPFDSPVYYF